jgi:hypothetical protein
VLLPFNWRFIVFVLAGGACGACDWKLPADQVNATGKPKIDEPAKSEVYLGILPILGVKLPKVNEVKTPKNRGNTDKWWGNCAIKPKTHFASACN